ncbi:MULTISPECIES: hypothetical protein [unclassified Prochlorococcus]|uniref:hypothetical protein n=1 Tax=unclassified Prochlorococcus TaxID=2627481 RepID=UPI0005641274|nr:MULTISPECIES: hypothetical protein [unclassified Prochlorococcus]
MKSSVKILLYILAWIIAWLAFSFIIDSGLVTIKVYNPGTKGSLITFTCGAFTSLIGATSLYREVFTDDLTKEDAKVD